MRRLSRGAELANYRTWGAVLNPIELCLAESLCKVRRHTFFDNGVVRVSGPFRASDQCQELHCCRFCRIARNRESCEEALAEDLGRSGSDQDVGVFRQSGTEGGIDDLFAGQLNQILAQVHEAEVANAKRTDEVLCIDEPDYLIAGRCIAGRIEQFFVHRNAELVDERLQRLASCGPFASKKPFRSMRDEEVRGEHCKLG